MSRNHSSLPVVGLAPDEEGRPTRLSIGAKLTKPVPIVSDGRRLGEVDPTGKVTWIPAGSKGSFGEFAAQSAALQDAARARKRLRASVIDDKVVAVVVSRGRVKRDPPTRPAIEKSGPAGRVLKVK